LLAPFPDFFDVPEGFLVDSGMSRIGRTARPAEVLPRGRGAWKRETDRRAGGI